MLICFFDQEGIVHQEFVPSGMTVNADFYCDVLRRLRENVRRKRAQKWRNQNLIIHNDNVPAHRSFKVSLFLAKNNMTLIPHPPYSPDLAPCDFFLFPKLKLRMKGQTFDTIEEIRITVGTWHNSKKGLPGMLPGMAETLGPLYSCKRGVLWGWWRNLTSKVSKLLFTSTVLELLDTPLYEGVHWRADGQCCEWLLEEDLAWSSEWLPEIYQPAGWNKEHPCVSV